MHMHLYGHKLWFQCIFLTIF